MSINHNGQIKLPLFSAFGVEIEYMIVDKDSLNVLPIADQLLFAIAKDQVSDAKLDQITLSNEMFLHVIELKCSNPSKSLLALPQMFQQGVKSINKILSDFNACLLPTGAHPFMNPLKDSKIWTHDNNSIYQAYDRIFNCSGHGWANLQSVHLNLPFADDAEFAKLHTAIRLLLPIIPALSASSPLLDGKNTGFLDGRLEIYRNNQKIIPSIAGKIIPECVLSKSEYEENILQPIYKDMAVYDTEKILQHEWLNSRGSIARFERNTIEIRIIDTQECPLVDISILYLIVEVLKALISEKWCSFNSQQNLTTNQLALIFDKVIKSGGNSIISDSQYLTVFGYENNQGTVKALWQYIFEALNKQMLHEENFISVLQNILYYGSLSERILRKLNNNFSIKNMLKVYHELSECVAYGLML